MPTTITAPDGTLIDFPDSMKDADIEAAMGKLYPRTPGTEKTGLPPVPSAPLPPALSQGGDTFRDRHPSRLGGPPQKSQPHYSVNNPPPDPSAIFGPVRALAGATQIANPNNLYPDQKMRGLHNIIAGTGESLWPLAAEAGIPALVGGAVLGGAGKLIGTELPKAFGVSPGTSEVIGDVTSIPAAMAGGGMARSISEIPLENWLNAGEKISLLNPGSLIKAGRALFAPTPESSIARGSSIGGYARPDYSNLIRQLPDSTAGDTPPVSEPGSIARGLMGRPVVSHPSGISSALPAPRFSGGIPERIPATAPVPRPESYIAVPESGRLVEPWRVVPGRAAVPSETVSGEMPNVRPSLRIGQTPAERLQELSNSKEGTVGTRAEMMRQLRLAGKGENPATEQVIRRFERPEYTPREGK